MCTASVSSASSSLPSPSASSQITASVAASRIAAASAASAEQEATIEELGRSTASACNLIDDDFAGSSDEVKIFKDEGEDEEKEYVSQEELQAALSEDKSSLIQETELSIKQEAALRLTDSTIGKLALPERQNHRKSRIQHSKFVKNAQSGLFWQVSEKPVVVGQTVLPDM